MIDRGDRKPLGTFPWHCVNASLGPGRDNESVMELARSWQFSWIVNGPSREYVHRTSANLIRMFPENSSNLGKTCSQEACYPYICSNFLGSF